LILLSLIFKEQDQYSDQIDVGNESEKKHQPTNEDSMNFLNQNQKNFNENCPYNNSFAQKVLKDIEEGSIF